MNLGEARRAQTLSEAQRLVEDVEAWTAARKSADVDATGYRGRYETQLNVISSHVLGATERVRTEVADGAVGSVGEACKRYNAHDQRLIWIRYAWAYFRDKLDQRDDPALKSALEAADEISWSCHSSFFRGANMLPIPAAPIPYIEYDYVPSALSTGQGHVLKRKPGADAGPLEQYFASLPLPLLRLPPSVVTSPWSLALICHESGHLIQEHVEPENRFFATFADAISDVVTRAGGADDDRRRWSRWNPEIFADMCLAASAGPWAVWAVAPWVLTTDDAMNVALDNYPAPAVRLRLLDAMARGARWPANAEVLKRLGIEGEADVVAGAVADLAERQFTINGTPTTFAAVLGLAPAKNPHIRVEQWSNALLASTELVAKNDPTSARDAAVAAVRAHFLALERNADLRALAERTLAFVRANHAMGVRAGTKPIAPAESLESAIFALSADELGAAS